MAAWSLRFKRRIPKESRRISRWVTTAPRPLVTCQISFGVCDSGVKLSMTHLTIQTPASPAVADSNDSPLVSWLWGNAIWMLCVPWIFRVPDTERPPAMRLGSGVTRVMQRYSSHRAATQARWLMAIHGGVSEIKTYPRLDASHRTRSILRRAKKSPACNV